MEIKPEETKKGKHKLMDYVRLILIWGFGLIVLATVFMAVYRKFGG